MCCEHIEEANRQAISLSVGAGRSGAVWMWHWSLQQEADLDDVADKYNVLLQQYGAVHGLVGEPEVKVAVFRNEAF